jgi:SAM-dependent methyltransferase
MLDEYRAADYFEGEGAGYVDYDWQAPAQRATFRRIVREIVQRGFAGGDLLEVGAGYGFFLEQASSAFRTCVGTELSEQATAVARERGLSVLVGDLQAVPPEPAYDCIFSAHVLEHVYRPHEFLAAARQRLRPGGVMVLGTPDAGSFWRRLLGRRWPSYKIPEHVQYFNTPSLARLMREAELEDIQPFPFAHAFPLALVAQRAGVPFPQMWRNGVGRRPVWLPATTLGMSARQPAG